MKGSLYIALFVAFVDYIGIGLIYPLFSSMLFDTTRPFLPSETSHEMRGALLGMLLALSPLSQFFSSPIWGALSDSKGRKRLLQFSLVIGLVGYVTALSGVLMGSIVLLFVSRIIIGISAGNMAIVQATIADLSSKEEKAKNFGLYSMALGAGFTLGPFFGGFLSQWGYSIPFVFAAFIIALNIIFAFAFFKETHHHTFERKLSWHMGITQLKKAFHFYGIRTILFTYFLHCFGWSFFFEFAPVYLITNLQFSPAKLGLFYGASGCFYALSTGLLIRPFVRRLKPETLFFAGNLFAALAILALPFLPSPLWLWPLLFVICYFIAFVSPTATTIVSNSASPQIQGEALGILGSFNAAALVLSPLFSGSFVGAHPTFSMWIGGTLMLAVALIVLAIFRKRLFSPL